MPDPDAKQTGCRSSLKSGNHRMQSTSIFRPRDLVLIILTAVGAWGFSVACHFYEALDQPFRDGTAPESISIRRGSSARSIALLLAKDGLVPSRWHFLAATWLDKSTMQLQAGEYCSETALSPRQWVANLRQGNRRQYKITIPEGWTADQIAKRLEEEGLVSSNAFLGAASNPVIPKQFGLDTPNAEGYLFPETYTFEKPLSATAAVETMIKQFLVQCRDLGSFKHEAVVLASIIEKESSREENMKQVSAVFHNRLKLGRPLQSDATVLYALQREGQAVQPLDTGFKSPYNTYRYPGLPPGALCNPSRAALAAAVNPATGDWLYFQSDDAGKFYFAHTHREHLRIKQQLRKARNEKDKQ